MAHEFIDLDLPSGTLWATENEPEKYQFNKARKIFCEQLPSIKSWEELIKNCRRESDIEHKRLILTGPNGNKLYLPTTDFNYEGSVCSGYWSSSPHGVDYAHSMYIFKRVVSTKWSAYRLAHLSVRLCKQA